MAEAEVIKQAMSSWSVKEQCINLVFDTTATNSSPLVGACLHLELYVGHLVLWSACRHHVYELYIKKVTDVILGDTDSPGVSLFKRLAKDWHGLQIDYNKLQTLNFDSLPDWVREEGKSVLKWAEQLLFTATWVREDYKEFCQLVVVALGGQIDKFRFRLPGADHHARWLSKGIYLPKIFLLSSVFKLTVEEEEQVRRLVIFILVFYARPWMQAPVAAAAPRNDLNFHLNILRYRKLEPVVAYRLLEVIRRHQWYLTAQWVPLALADKEVPEEEREDLAKTIYSFPREEIESGKPEYPILEWTGVELKRPSMSGLVTMNSWLVFDLLGLQGAQVL